MDPSNPEKPKRPVGITILAILFLVGGIGIVALGVGLFLFLPSDDGGIDRVLDVLGANRLSLFLGFGVLAALGIAGGVGMLRGAAWGWWIGGFYSVYAIARNAMAALALPEIAESAAALGEPDPDLTKHYIKFIGRVVINLLLVLYFYRLKVLSYFGLVGLSRMKAIGTQVLVCLLLTGAFVLLSMLPG